MADNNYTENEIRSLDWKDHIRLRPGMYIGKLGDGRSSDDGIYVLIKEIIDNCIDEYVMGHGKVIDVRIDKEMVHVRDFGRGVPLGKLIECVSRINTGGKYDSKAFKKSVGLNGVGTKAVNALSSHFMIRSIRDGKQKTAEFERGELSKDHRLGNSSEKNGTIVEFIPDKNIFKGYRIVHSHVESMIWNYVYLNSGLTIMLNGKPYLSKNGLLDLLDKTVGEDTKRYPIIHLKGDDIEVAITHGPQTAEIYESFVNGQYTTMGGTHQSAFREAYVKTVKDHFKKDFEPQDVRSGIIAALSVRVEEPVFESQTKTKLGSLHRSPGGESMRSWIFEFLRRELDNFLHKNPEIAKALSQRILQSERERKEMAGIKKIANERAKKANVFNRKLRDCKAHLNSNHKYALQSSIFITEGDSASGSITKARNPDTQAVFSLRGKPLNSFGLTKKIVYENEEFNLLQHALNIENGIEDLRYQKIIVATDADVDGMHIRLLILTFFLQFFPELVKENHIFILQTPLFRVRNSKKTFYCYDENDRRIALKEIGDQAEITRFKGLGEISPDEFGNFIGKDMRIEPVRLSQNRSITDLLRYYMGKNSQDRQQFIVDNLRADV